MKRGGGQEGPAPPGRPAPRCGCAAVGGAPRQASVRRTAPGWTRSPRNSRCYDSCLRSGRRVPALADGIKPPRCRTPAMTGTLVTARYPGASNHSDERTGAAVAAGTPNLSGGSGHAVLFYRDGGELIGQVIAFLADPIPAAVTPVATA